MKRKITKGVSWQSEALLEAAQQKARDLGMSFSGYVCHLVRKDLGFKGVFSQDAAADPKLAEPPVVKKPVAKKK